MRALDATFETELLGQVLDEDQGQRMLLEVPPRDAPSPIPRPWTPEERAQQARQAQSAP